MDYMLPLWLEAALDMTSDLFAFIRFESLHRRCSDLSNHGSDTNCDNPKFPGRHRWVYIEHMDLINQFYKVTQRKYNKIENKIYNV